MIEQYFDDTLAAGFAGQNQMLTTLSAMPVSYTHLHHLIQYTDFITPIYCSIIPHCQSLN